MKILIDLTGMKFGRWTVITRASNDKNNMPRWLCECDCGNFGIVYGHCLKRGQSKSCGCLQKDSIAAFHSKGSTASRKVNSFYDNGKYLVGIDENNNEFYFDYCDFEKLKKCYWGVQVTGYVSGCINSKGISLHRYLMNPGNGLEVDHINHIRFDCRRSNMRNCKREDNAKNQPILSSNTSGHRGVEFHSCKGLWRARIRVDGRRVELGHFETAELAHRAYKSAAIKYHGEFANF